MSYKMQLEENSTKALQDMAKVATKPWYKKAEFWIGIIANAIALAAFIRTF